MANTQSLVLLVGVLVGLSMLILLTLVIFECIDYTRKKDRK